MLRHDHNWFQSTRPRGTRRTRFRLLCLPATFQSTRPRGTRPSCPPPLPTCPARFNPRVRAGRDMSTAMPAPLRASFNPRVRAGRDDKPVIIRINLICVSIHASARDATWRKCDMDHKIDSFNPRVRAGRDIICKYTLFIIGCFNPRVRAGRDATRSPKKCRAKFQSTRPRGTRPECLAGMQILIVSIHASARDATANLPEFSASTLFQSTRPRGTRPSRPPPDISATEFQSTRPRGTRLFP